MTKHIKLILIIVFAFIFSNGYAQINKREVKRKNKAMANYKGQNNGFTKQKKYFYVGIGVNSMNYFGDIAPKSGIFSTKISSTRPGFALSGGYRVGPRYTLEASLSYGTIFSDDNKAADPIGETSNYRYKRNLHFRNNILELAVMGVFKQLHLLLMFIQVQPFLKLGNG